MSVVDNAASVAVAAPGEVAPQFEDRVCRTIERLARRFNRFPFLARIFDTLRAAFGCISPG